jgi:hypothetical protein
MTNYRIPVQVTATLIDVVGIIANSLSLSYFIKRRRGGLTEKLFMTLNSFDLLVCVSNFSAMVMFQINLHSNENKAAKTSYLTSCFFYSVAFDCTGFLTSLISVTRTIKVCRPFFSIKGAWTAASFLLYLLCSITRELVINYQLFIKPKVENVAIIVKYYPVLYALGTVSSTIAVVLSSIVTAYWLLSETRYKRKISKNNRHATITVLILSAVFFMINAIFVSAAIISFCFNIEVIEFGKSWHTYRDIVFSLSECLNSTINPMIYLTRKKEMRRFVVGTCRRAKDRVSSLGAERKVDISKMTMRRPNDNVQRSCDNPDTPPDDQC